MAGYGYLQDNDVEAGLFDKTTPSYEFAEKEVRIRFRHHALMILVELGPVSSAAHWVPLLWCRFALVLCAKCSVRIQNT